MSKIANKGVIMLQIRGVIMLQIRGVRVPQRWLHFLRPWEEGRQRKT